MRSTRDQWAAFAKGEAPIEKTTRAKPSDLEFKIQSGFIDWVRIVEVSQIPSLQLLYAIPNGGHRHASVGGKMKREGVSRGIPDLHLPIARRGYHSLYLETKAPGGKLSKWQIEKKEMLETYGNSVIVCYSIGDLIDAVTEYLQTESN